mgnify:CR=1 FL=1
MSDYFSKPFKINVTKQALDQAIKELFLEVKVSDNNVVVGEQVILTYTFYTRIASKVLSTELYKVKFVPLIPPLLMVEIWSGHLLTNTYPSVAINPL